MEPSSHQQAYDRGSTLFSPDGRLYQVEYAREAVERGSPSVGVTTDAGVVLAARKRLRSPLLESSSVEKIHLVDDHVAIASAGHAADARQLVDVARRTGQQHRVRYGEPIGIEALANQLADRIQTNTQRGGSRPYGAALLVGGVERRTDGSRPRLFEVDPSGTAYGWDAVAIGTDGDERTRFFEDRIGDAAGSERADRRWGTHTALEALQATVEDTLDPAALDVRSIDPESATVERISDAEIEGHLEEIAS
ncbi:archaeal proteasome endopeptidase complex subunit alpha [Halosolutus halophilus]|uniref:archaeal proteasome endopeptidase complex subunit alpha n=1 Tax=Halosolutus halophilus TaxID=1552990 RepID=UPI0022350BC1|nr:archaeal proteasome endopeptidase complex subunit alpha [Halosolutus halophilus]